VTWAAGNLFGRADPHLVEILQAHPILRHNLYLLPDPQLTIQNESSLLPDLTLPGMLVGRRICDPANLEFHGAGAIRWDTIAGPEDHEVWVPQVFPEHGLKYPQEYEAGHFAPLPFLRLLKNLYLQTGTTLSFYDCFMWGGEMDWEVAHVFGPQEIVLVFARLRQGAPEYLEYRGPDQWVRRSGDVLVQMMAHHGVSLKGPFFPPHTRTFAWERYRLQLN
jgi:hypothetical protein